MTAPITLAASYFGAIMALSLLMIVPLSEWLASFKKSLHFQHQVLVMQLARQDAEDQAMQAAER